MTQKQKLKKIIREELSKYQEFFKSALEKFGVESPNELSDEKKNMVILTLLIIVGVFIPDMLMNLKMF